MSNEPINSPLSVFNQYNNVNRAIFYMMHLIVKYPRHAILKSICACVFSLSSKLICLTAHLEIMNACVKADCKKGVSQARTIACEVPLDAVRAPSEKGGRRVAHFPTAGVIWMESGSGRWITTGRRRGGDLNPATAHAHTHWHMHIINYDVHLIYPNIRCKTTRTSSSMEL